MNKSRKERVAALAAIVGDDGTGDLGVIVDHAPLDATTEDLAEIVREAREEHRANLRTAREVQP